MWFNSSVGCEPSYLFGSRSRCFFSRCRRQNRLSPEVASRADTLGVGHPYSGFIHLKHLIRNKSTGHFLTLAGSWSQYVSSAFNFPNTPKAIAEKERLGLKHVELVLMRGHKPSR